MKKYIKLNDLNKIRKKYVNKKIVLCHGVFDIIHFGHINHLKKAKNFGDILVVTLTADKFVNKGENRPYYNVHNRVKVMESIGFIDFICISENETAVEIIRKLKPEYYCKGIEYKKKDYTENIKKEINELKKNKGKIVFTDEESSSSSKIINDLFSVLPDQNKNFINKIKLNFNLKKIEEIFDELKKKNILVIGEIIVDQITNCSVIGNSSKDLHLIVKEESSKKYLGGTGSISNYISKFCNVTLLSIIGSDQDKHGIKELLDIKIKNKIFVEKRNNILKKRYVDLDNNKKLFGTYDVDHCVLSKKNERKIIQFLKKNINKYDKIILSDYSHNFINKTIIKFLIKTKQKIIVNSQINAHNFGYHSYLKFKDFDFLIANEKEIRHDLHDSSSNINELILKFTKKYKFKHLVVTRGASGLIYYNKKSNIKTIYPAFGEKIIDKVGAGDTLLAFVSLLFDRAKKNNDISFFISSLAAAENIKDFYNSARLDKNLILKKIMHLLA